MALSKVLEDFGDPAAGRESDAERRRKAELAAARGEGHAAGYAEGFAAGLAQAETDERATVMRLVEVAHDHSLQHAGARAETLLALRPLLMQLVELAAPAAAARGLAEEVAAAVGDRLPRARDATMVLKVAPANAEALRARFEERLAVEVDATMGANAARLDWPDGGALFDADGALAAAMAAIDDFFGEIETANPVPDVAADNPAPDDAPEPPLAPEPTPDEDEDMRDVG
jgi:flagellar biosynthesis/type III secretory pathway protein FliH